LLAGYEAGNVGRRGNPLSAELTEDLATIATKSGVAKTRVLKMFASHIAGFFVQSSGVLNLDGWIL